jgi:uncharacterized protein
MTLDLLPGSYALYRWNAGGALLAWAVSRAFCSITRTANELSIVCASGDVPADVLAQREYRGLVVRGPLEFNEIGIIAALSAVLAAASISIFAVSTYDTDYLFVRGEDLDRAVAALHDAGHSTPAIVDA